MQFDQVYKVFISGGEIRFVTLNGQSRVDRELSETVFPVAGWIRSDEVPYNWHITEASQKFYWGQGTRIPIESIVSATPSEIIGRKQSYR